jgi:hypothetical protein
MMQGAFSEDLASGSAAFTPQYAQLQMQPNPTQLEILGSYVEQYLIPKLNGFITAAPTDPNLQPLHRFIFSCAFTMPSELFIALLNKYYPEMLNQNDPNFEQHYLLRSFLIQFNKLCIGEVDINHQLFSHVFDPKISPKKDSPTKKRMVATFIQNQLRPHVEIPGLMEDTYVHQANLWLIQQHGASINAVHSARKKLFF